MIIRSIVASCFAFLTLAIGLTQSSKSPQDDVIAATNKWLKDISAGDRTALNGAMDGRFLATTPAGDIITKDRLVPDDTSSPVQQLPPLELDSPIVRLYGDTAVLMARLKSASGSAQALNGTFVYAKQNGHWKLVALHLSPQK
jgi:hypothetical protein